MNNDFDIHNISPKQEQEIKDEFKRQYLISSYAFYDMIKGIGYARTTDQKPKAEGCVLGSER